MNNNNKDLYLDELKSGKTSLSYDEWLIKKNDEQKKGKMILLLIASLFLFFWMIRFQLYFFKALYKFIRIPLKEDIKFGRAITLIMAAALVIVLMVKFDNFDKRLLIILVVSVALFGNWFFYSLMLRLTNLGLPLFQFWKK